MRDNRLSIILCYKGTNTYAFNTLVGALEIQPDLTDVPIQFVREYEKLALVTREELEKADRVLVAWSFFSPDFQTTVDMLTNFKKTLNDNRVIHIAGGVHASAEPQQTIRAGFDLAALGEGEKIIVDLVRTLCNDGDYKKVTGISYAEGDRLAMNGVGELIDLNTYPPFAEKHHKFSPIEITRGCIYACKFCQTPFMFKAKFRHRTVENICKYVQIMKDNGLKDIRFITPTSLSYGSKDGSVHPEKIEELLSAIRGVLGEKGRIFFGSFPSEVRPEHVTIEILKILKKYVNNDNIIIGAQSGSERILDFAHRGHGAEEVVKAVQACLQVGFIPNIDLIFGLPGEEREDVDATLDLADKLTKMGARIHGHTFMPLPGTPFRSEKPGNISPNAWKKLKRLESTGKLYGDWKSQIEIAQRLSQFIESQT